MCCRKADGQDPAGGKRQKQQPQTDAQTDLQFGKMDMGQSAQLGTQHKKKKPSKEQLLQEAVQKQKQTADGGSEPQVRRNPFTMTTLKQTCPFIK